MGVYMSQPLREKDSIDEEGAFLYYGASSMQGWRMTQEDAHNCCLEYDKEKNMSLFAVYDGHGGAEVAQYTAINFPEFIKSIPQFKEGRLSQGLEDAFLAFDAELITSDVITKLKELAGVTEDEQNEEERQEELKGLSEDADMPLEQLLQRYQAGGAVKSLQELRKSDLVPSPALRGKKPTGNTGEGNEDIKENLDEKLVNGEGDCNGDNNHTVSDNMCKDSEGSSEVIGKGDGEINDKEAVASVKQVDTTESKCPQNDANDIKKEEPIKEDDMDSECQQSDAVKVKVCSVSECSEAAASGPMDTKKSGGSIKDGKNAETLPDSTQADSTPNKTNDAKQDPKSEANGDTEVSSSSEGSKSRQTVCQPSTGSSSSSCETSVSVPEESGTNPSSSGESASLEQTTGPSSDRGGGGALSSYSAVADSSSKAEPCSSSGRRRSGRKNVIPEEGEDESSFDDDEDTTDEEDSDEDVDEGDLVEEDSEEESEEEMGGEEEGEVAEEDDGVTYSMEPGYDSGCTAVVAVLKGRELFVANAGDSRCVLCREGKAVDMSFDHKPEDEIELRRILTAGGQVTPDGRVNGGLNLSRAIGDHAYKKNSNLPLRDQMISALPDVRCVTLDEKDEFMVLACDGIWNSLSSQDTVTFVRDRFEGGVKDLSTICEELFECCLAPNTSGDGSGCDNMTCVIVRFKDELWKLPSCSTVKRRASSEADSSQTEPKKVKEGD